MTKKSENRILRDARRAEAVRNASSKLKDNTCWDDLNGTYQACVEMLQKHGNLQTLAQNKEVIARVKDKTTLINNIRTMATDLRNMNGELSEIYGQHKGKSGGSQDPDEVIRTIQIFEQYQLFMTRHDAVVMPTVYHIIEQFDEAEKELARDQAHAVATNQAQDPSHSGPIDVQFNDVSNAPIVSPKPEPTKSTSPDRPTVEVPSAASYEDALGGKPTTNE